MVVIHHIDPDANDTFSYSLVRVGLTSTITVPLVLSTAINYRIKDCRTLRPNQVTAFGSEPQARDGLFLEKVLTINVNDL